MNTTTILEAPNQYELMLNNYASILEKTNSQLSLWLNPYGIMVGVLTIIIAIAAIVVSVYLWRNSREQKKQVNEFYSKQEESIKEQMRIIKEKSDKESALMMEREKKAKEYEKSLDNLISSYKDKIDKLGKDNEKDIERIEKVVDELNKAKASLGNYELPEATYDLTGSPPYARYSDVISRTSAKQTTCMYCGIGFMYKDGDGVVLPSSITAFSNRKVKCPHCGAENYV